ncbi:MAG: sporulation protein YunB [Bacillota bacterium]|nr:sporulation protein YunB [Bacillota bacterium]
MSHGKTISRRLWYLRRGNKKKLRLYLSLFLGVVLLTLLIFYADRYALPNIVNASEYQAEVLVTSIINEEAVKHIDENAQYGNYVSINRDSDNRVSSVNTDVVKLDRLMEDINTSIKNRLKALKNKNITIPFSVIYTKNAVKSTGSGLKAKLNTTDDVKTDYVSVITPFGTDGATHRILIRIKSRIEISFLFLAKKSFDIVCDVPLTEMLYKGNLAPAFLSDINAAVYE